MFNHHIVSVKTTGTHLLLDGVYHLDSHVFA